MKKFVSLLLILGCISTTISCKKETITKESETTASVESQSVSSDATADRETKFGVLVNGDDADQKIKVAKLLGVDFVRDAIILEDFDGKSLMLDKYLENGFKVLLNLNYGHTQNDKGKREPKRFPSDMAKYRRLLTKVLDKYKPRIAVIENEPLNDNHYGDKIENYIVELKHAIEVCHRYDVKVADGGISASMTCMLVYKDYLRKGMHKAADNFARRALDKRQVKAAKGEGDKDLMKKIKEAEKLIKADASLDLDFVNIHWYEPLKDDSDPKISAPGVLKEVADYLRRITGKRVITNEFGQFNFKPSLTKSFVDAFRSADFRFAIMFSGFDSDGLRNTQSLHQGRTLTTIGETFRKAIK